MTDAVLKVPDDPPAIIQEDPRALLFHARDTMTDIVDDTQSIRRKGWRRFVYGFKKSTLFNIMLFNGNYRMALFGLTFFPSGIDVSGVFETFSQLKNVTDDMKSLGQGPCF